MNTIFGSSPPLHFLTFFLHFPWEFTCPKTSTDLNFFLSFFCQNSSSFCAIVGDRFSAQVLYVCVRGWFFFWVFPFLENETCEADYANGVTRVKLIFWEEKNPRFWADSVRLLTAAAISRVFCGRPKMILF